MGLVHSRPVRVSPAISLPPPWITGFGRPGDAPLTARATIRPRDVVSCSDEATVPLPETWIEMGMGQAVNHPTWLVN